MIYKPFDIIVVPFPLTDKSTSKRRPAVVISSTKGFNDETEHVICAMITTAKHSSWKSDTEITDLDSAGLSVDSVIRLKVFTLDQILIIRKAGTLAKKDQKIFKKTIENALF